jgi:foldase protein PrsA
MNIWKKGAVLALTAAMLCTTTACQPVRIIMSPQLRSNEVFRMGDESCYLSEVMVYLVNLKDQYRTMYGIDLWENKSGTEQLEQYVKDKTIAHISEIMCMELLAREQNVELTTEEEDAIDKAAEAYYDSLTKEEISYMKADQSTIRNLYEQYTLASKLYETLTADISFEVSDDEARVMHAQVIHVSDKKTAKEVQKKLAAGTDFLSVASSYNESEEITQTYDRTNVSQEMEDVIFQLENDEISSMIETEDGYYFVKCIEKFDKELTDENKELIVQKRREDAFDAVYKDFKDNLTVEFNHDLWDNIHLTEEDGEADHVQTSDFFDVYNEYMDGL